MKNKLNTKIFNSKDNNSQKLIAVLVVIAVATLGYVLLTGTRASGPYASANAIAGAVVSPATSIAGTGGAAGHNVVQFGSAPGSGAIVPNVPAGTSVPTNVAFDDEFNKGSLNTSAWTPYWFTNGAQSNNTTMESSNISVDSNGLELNLASNQTGSLVSTNPDDGSGHPGFQVQPTASDPVFVEYKAQLPGSGTEAFNWPALWITGQNWPQTGELDLMEGFGDLQSHTIYGGCGNFCNPGITLGNWAAGFHTFGLLWTTTSTTFYYDGKDMGGSSLPYNIGPLYLVMENSLGSPASTPATITVRYARVWH